MTSGTARKTRLGSRDPLSACPPERAAHLQSYSDMLAEVNRSVNLISRESVDERWTRHILHSLCLGLKPFPRGSRVVDWGTGGGLPLVPLAIAFPEVRFVGVDSVRKKVLAVRSIIRRLQIENAGAVHARAESWVGVAEYSVSRATAPLARLWRWHTRIARPGPVPEGCWPAGLVCLKGGDLSDEVAELLARYHDVHVDVLPLAEITSVPEFAGKQIVSVTSAPPS